MGHIDGLEEIPIRHVTDTEVQQARRTVCSYAVDRDEAAYLLDMLGIGPTVQEMQGGWERGVTIVGNLGRCVKCGVATESSKDRNRVGAAYGALGRCERCYGQLRRERAKEAKDGVLRDA